MADASTRLRRAESRAAELEAEIRLQDAERRVRALQQQFGAQPSLEQRIGGAERRLLALQGTHARGREAACQPRPLAEFLDVVRNRWAMLVFVGSVLFWAWVVLSHPSTYGTVPEVSCALARARTRARARARALIHTRVLSCAGKQTLT